MQVSLLPAEAAPDFALPQPLYARDGTVFLQQLPAALPAALRAVHTPLQDWLEQNPEDPAHAQLLELYFALQDIAAQLTGTTAILSPSSPPGAVSWNCICSA